MQQASAPIVWAGRVGMVMSLAATILLFVKDPFHLVLPLTLTAALLGYVAIRRGGEKLAAAQIAMNVGLMNVLLWLVVIAVM